MKVKVDENLPFRLVVALREQGHDVQTVREEGLAGCFAVLTDTKLRIKRQ